MRKYHYMVEDFGSAQRHALFVRKDEAQKFFDRAPLINGEHRELIQGNYSLDQLGVVRAHGRQFVLESDYDSDYEDMWEDEVVDHE